MESGRNSGANYFMLKSDPFSYLTYFTMGEDLIPKKLKRNDLEIPFFMYDTKHGNCFYIEVIFWWRRAPK